MPTPPPPKEHQFKKGQKAHPKAGRPKGSGIDKLLLKLLKENSGVINKKTGKELTNAEAMTLRFIKTAIASKNDTCAANNFVKILERTEGKTPEEFNINGTQSMDLTLGLNVIKPDAN